MFINFWYPVCVSNALGNEQPVRVELLGLRFVAFRDSAGPGQGACLSSGGALRNCLRLSRRSVRCRKPPICPVPEFGQPGWRANRIVEPNINCMLYESMDEKVEQVNLWITGEDIGVLEELWPGRFLRRGGANPGTGCSNQCRW